MTTKQLNELIATTIYELHDFRTKLNTNMIDKNRIQKYYDDALRKINIEVGNFKNNTYKYDKSIYIDDDILYKKLTMEIRNIVNSFKYNIMKNIKDNKAEIIEREAFERDELNSELFLEDINEMLDMGLMGVYGGKLEYF